MLEHQEVEEGIPIDVDAVVDGTYIYIVTMHGDKIFQVVYDKRFVVLDKLEKDYVIQLVPLVVNV